MAGLLHIVVLLCGVGVVGVTLPLVVELWVLSFAAVIPVRRVRGGVGWLRLAVIVPAHDEERLIGACVRSLVGAGVEGVTVYVVAHNCSDATGARAREAGAEVLTLTDSVGGKGRALDFGFREAIGRGAQAVMVVDADSVVRPGLLAGVSGALAGGAEAVQARYEVLNAGANRRTRLAALAFVGMNVVRPLGRSRLGLSCGIFGNGFGMRAETLAEVPYTANSLVEDLEYHLQLLRAGKRVEFLNDVAVRGEMPETDGAAGSQRARWEGGRILMRRMWTWPLVKDVLAGRVRMVEPLLDLLALPLATEVGVLGVALLEAVLNGVGWLAAYAVFGMVGVAVYVGVSVGLGVERGATLKALGGVPGFLVWKVLMMPRTRMAAKRDAEWVRTKRN